MKILVVGSKGFVGSNFVAALKNIRDKKDRSRSINSDIKILEYDIDSNENEFDQYCKECDFVFNFVGVHKAFTEEEFMNGNCGFLTKLLNTLEKNKNTCPVVFSSSIQAALDNPYGHSKKAAEDALFDYAKRVGTDVYIFRFPNLFGKWSRPNYNSVVATFCYNIARDLPIQIRDENYEMHLVYIDDVVEKLLDLLNKNVTVDEDGFCKLPVYHSVTLGKLAEMIYSFKESRENNMVPDMTDNSFSKKLYSTYLSYLPEDKFSYFPKVNVDERGSFTEILKSLDCGQVSVNVSKPGITKGKHWHNTKNEKFIVVSGKAVIRFRKINEEKVYEYYVSGDKLEIVDIPTGYTHSIENIGDSDLITLIWANECFNPEKPDTYYEEV